MINRFKKYSIAKMWFLSWVIFLGSTLVITLLDYFGERWLNIAWPRGADAYPNMILGIPLFFIQLLAAYLLISAGVKTYNTYKGLKGVLFALALIFSTGLSCLLIYALIGFWYQLDFMGRSM